MGDGAAGHPSSIVHGAAAPGAARWSFLRPPSCSPASRLGVSPALAQMLTFPPRPKPAGQARTRAGSRCSCAREEINYDYTQRARLRRRQRAALLWQLDARSRPGDLRSENQAPARGRKCPADRRRTARSPTARSWTSATTFATASSIRCGSTRPSRPASRPTRAERSGGNFTVFHNGVYTACEPCKDDPTKPPKWQVKAARIIHDQARR